MRHVLTINSLLVVRLTHSLNRNDFLLDEFSIYQNQGETRIDGYSGLNHLLDFQHLFKSHRFY
jgi:hypothetical protein